SRITACPRTLRQAKAGSLLLRYRNELVALRFHAEIRQAALRHHLLAVGIDECAARPDHLAWRDHDRLELVLIQVGLELRLAPGGLAAGLRVAADLLGRNVGLHPLHRRAGGKTGGEDDERDKRAHSEF